MKSLLQLLVAAAIVVVQFSVSRGITLEKFKSVYDSLQRQVLDRSGEVAQIDSFTYIKDVATFHFGRGAMLLQRPVNGRPTLAAFVGEGHVHIDIPVAVERQSFRNLTGDSLIDQKFAVCFMRFADDFDVQVRNAATFSDGMMGTTEFGKVRDAQGEYFFKPTLYDLYDNLTQLALATFERRAEGYFYACTNHKIFLFDPNRPEEVNIFNADPLLVSLDRLNPSFQRIEKNKYAPEQISDLSYQLRMTRQDAILEMGGSDGWSILNAQVRSRLVVNSDSLQFVRLFLDKHLEPDSVTCNGNRVEWFRRYEFYHLELFLPHYAHKDDILAVTIWLHDAGDKYGVILPFTEDPALLYSTLQLIFPKGYNYAVPAQSNLISMDDHKSRCQAGPLFCRFLWFQALPTGFDTSHRSIGDSLSLTFIRPKDSKYLRQQLEDTTADAFQFFLQEFGTPSNLSTWYVFPYGNGIAPGLLRIPVTKGDRQIGGLHAVVANAVANAWFGPAFQPASYREEWMRQAVSEYLALIYAQKTTGNSVLFSELNGCREGIEIANDQKFDSPLALGNRANSNFRLNQGVWLLHMLRVLMFDTELLNDQKFMGFLKDVVTQANQQKFSNTDFCRLAEQHFGGPLDWFFAPWMYKVGFPAFNVEWNVGKKSDGFYVNLHVATSRVDSENIYPVMLKVVIPSGSALLRQAITGSKQEYRIGPFPEAPTDLKFNEYESVLCKSKIRKLQS